MIRWSLAAGASLALLSCTRAEGTCGPGGTCPAGQTCHLAYNICYVADPPLVSWAAPALDQRLTGSSAAASRIISFGGAFTAEISVGRPDAWQPLTVSSSGQFSTTVPLPPSDGVSQPFRVQITEAASAGGRVTVSSIYRTVDNVAPALAFSEPALRPTVTTVRVIASEPLSAAAAPAAVPVGAASLPKGGAWNPDHTELRYEGLDHDTTYAISIPAGALSDVAGNPTAAPFQVTFTTEPVAPASDLTIPIGSLDLTDLEASSDAEGAVSVALSSAQGLIVWGEFDARTGLFRQLSQAIGTGLVGLQTISAPLPDRRWEDDGTSRRASGMMMGRAVGGAVVQSLIYEDAYSDAGRGTFVSVNPGGLSYLPAPTGCLLPPGPLTLEVDPSSGQTLLRRGGFGPIPVALPATPSRTLFHSEASSEWVSVDAGTIFRTPKLCSATPGPSQVVASGAVAGTRLSVTDTASDDRAYAYDTPSGRTLTCFRDCDAGVCVNAGSESDVAGSEISVASANQSSFALEAVRSGGSVILYRRDLRRACGSGPTPTEELGRLTTGSSIRRFRPVMFGRRPGLLYLSTAGGPGVLRTYLP